MGVTHTFDGGIGVADSVSVSVSRGVRAALYVVGILRGSDGTLWDFMGILMAVSAH